MARRSYEQFCSLATALDVVGERWTLLLIRELLLGPRRFTDLLDGLPGIGRNLLAERLRHLEDEGLVARGSLPPPAASQVYELTDEGRKLGPALAELGRWGVERLGPRRRTQTFRPAWGMFPLSYMADRDAARDLNETWEFRIDEATFTLRVKDGRVIPRTGPADDPDLVDHDGHRHARRPLLRHAAGDRRADERARRGRRLTRGAPARRAGARGLAAERYPPTRFHRDQLPAPSRTRRKSRRLGFTRVIGRNRRDGRGRWRFFATCIRLTPERLSRASTRRRPPSANAAWTTVGSVWSRMMSSW